MHSERVAERIRHAIDKAGGSIGFAEFMQLALYAPGLGYYSAGAAKFGAGGDFITAPEVSPLFARVLARQCAPVLQALPERRILELGAGSGALAAELLRCLPRHGVELTRYSILEVSPDLRQRQQILLRQAVPELQSAVEWLDDLPDAFSGVVIANEVADALPVERFQRSGDDILQYRVTADGDEFSWLRARAPAFLERAVLHIEDTLGASLPHGYVSEVSTGVAAWIGDIAARIRQGFVFLFDYGVTRREYYAAERNDGWLRCHFRHHAHNDPLIFPGIQDLSSWVDFTAVAEGAAGAGMDIAGFVTQAQFLLHGGLEAELAAFPRQGAAAQLEFSREVKTLTLPGEMGEHFKCLGLSKDFGLMPAPFAASDRAHTL
ncbi:MAG TPA: SAM-dependent methyltransferase [Woeseiaceae bacterium]|nr:SAM-dependent methyltransferase [Woeseiaceae bacterium]